MNTHPLNENLIEVKNKLFTINKVPCVEHFELTDHIKRTINGKETELRSWDPNRSKIAAAIKKGLKRAGLRNDATILYLGASHGYTPSFLSDLITKGMLFCLDFAPRVVKDLVFVCEQRDNMLPILGDANKPEEYEDLVAKEVDVVFQDIAQKNQVEIFLKNCDKFLKKEGYGMIAIKARSMDVTKHPEKIFKIVKREFEENPNYNIIDYRELAPFEKDHCFITVKKK